MNISKESAMHQTIFQAIIAANHEYNAPVTVIQSVVQAIEVSQKQRYYQFLQRIMQLKALCIYARDENKLAGFIYFFINPESYSPDAPNVANV